MRIIHESNADRMENPESHTRTERVDMGRWLCERHVLGRPPSPRTEVALGRTSKVVGLMKNLRWLALLTVLGAAGQWRVTAVIVPPTTNRVVLTWSSLGPGTRYYIQTSTNLPTWTAATNTTATNVSLSFVADHARVFRLTASNAPPKSVMLAWDPSASTNAAGYFIYYGASTGSYTNLVDAGLGTNGVVSNLLSGTTYYFAATAYDSSGFESVFSNETAWQSPLRLKIQRLP